jgi:hypothetical protein
VQLQQQLLWDQQLQQQQTGALGPTAAGAAAAVLLAGVAAGAGYVWKHKQQPSAVAGGATTQQQQQQQQAWLNLPQVQQQLSAALTASVSRLQSSTAASAAAAAEPWQQLLAHIPGMRQAGTYTGTASAADTVAAAAVDTLQQSTGSRALRVGQQRQQQQQQLVGPQQPKGWWQTLDQVHYLNFGSRAGLLPRVDLPQQQQQQQRRQGLAGDAAGSLPAAAAAAAVEDGADVVTKQFLVAFQSKADAEYVCGVLQVGGWCIEYGVFVWRWVLHCDSWLAKFTLLRTEHVRRAGRYMRRRVIKRYCTQNQLLVDWVHPQGIMCTYVLPLCAVYCRPR